MQLQPSQQQFFLVGNIVLFFFNIITQKRKKTKNKLSLFHKKLFTKTGTVYDIHFSSLQADIDPTEGVT